MAHKMIKGKNEIIAPCITLDLFSIKLGLHFKKIIFVKKHIMERIDAGNINKNDAINSLSLTEAGPLDGTKIITPKITIVGKEHNIYQ